MHEKFKYLTSKSAGDLKICIHRNKNNFENHDSITGKGLIRSRPGFSLNDRPKRARMTTKSTLVIY